MKAGLRAQARKERALLLNIRISFAGVQNMHEGTLIQRVQRGGRRTEATPRLRTETPIYGDRIWGGGGESPECHI